MDAQTVEILLKAGQDQNANVRKAAALVMADVDSSHAKAALIKMLKDGVWQVKEQAINSIAKAGVKEAAAHLLKIIGCDDEANARKAILQWAAAKGDEAEGKQAAGGSPLTGGAAKKKPAGDPWQVKRAAALALSKLRPDLAAHPLMGMLKMDNPSVRTAAMVGLASIQAMESVDTLMEMASDDDWNMRKVAATTMGRLKAASATPALVKLLDDDKFTVRMEAVIALNHIKPPEAVEVLSKTVLKDSNYEVRKTAATALGNLKTEEATQALLEALKDDHWIVRKAALDALTNLRAPDALDAIIPFLADEEEEVRASASAGVIILSKVAPKKAD